MYLLRVRKINNLGVEDHKKSRKNILKFSKAKRAKRGKNWRVKISGSCYFKIMKVTRAKRGRAGRTKKSDFLKGSYKREQAQAKQGKQHRKRHNKICLNADQKNAEIQNKTKPVKRQ